MSGEDRRNTTSTSSNPVVRAIVNHWTVQHKEKPEAEEHLERNLCLHVPIIPFNRWILFFSAFIIQFCCGSLYSWSVYNTPIDKRVYPSAFDNPKKVNTANMAVNTFYIAVAVFGVTSAIMGPWLERHGPRNGLIVGSMVFGIGNAITAISLRFHSIVGVYIGYGVLGGFGLGLNYICPVSALQKWFPDYRGIASGFAVGGFGAGSVVWGKVIPLLLEKPNVEVQGTFGILGSIMTVTILVSSIAMRTPPRGFTVGGLDIEGRVVASKEEKVEYNSEKQEETVVDIIPTDATKETRHYTLIESIQSLDFICMYLMMFANEVFGLVAISRLANMCTDVFGKSSDEGATSVSVNGAFNCVGRLILPMISDLSIRYYSRDGNRFNPAFARKCIFWFTLCFQIAIVSSMPHIMRTQQYDAFRALIWILTACYGSGWGTIPCFLTDMFGPWNIGALHGIILTSWSIAGVGGGLGFNSRYNMILADSGGDYAGAYISNFYWIVAILAFGVVTSLFIRTNPADRNAPGYRFSFFGIKVFHIGVN